MNAKWRDAKFKLDTVRNGTVLVPYIPPSPHNTKHLTTLHSMCHFVTHFTFFKLLQMKRSTPNQRSLVRPMKNPFAAELELERQKKNFFRFLDLPAELREIVYVHLFSGDQSKIDICAFAGPAITRASRQLRSESVPVFFQNARFFANIASNWHQCQVARKVWEFYFDPELVESRLKDRYCQGQLCKGSTPISILEQAFGSPIFLRVASPEAIIKNITFRAAKVPIITDRSAEEALTQWRLSRGSCNVSLGAKFLRDDFPTKLTILGPEEATMYAIVATSKRVKQTARTIAARKGFRGFTFEDIEHIAGQFEWTRSVIIRVAGTGSYEEAPQPDNSQSGVRRYLQDPWASSEGSATPS